MLEVSEASLRAGTIETGGSKIQGFDSIKMSYFCRGSAVGRSRVNEAKAGWKSSWLKPDST